MKLKKAFTLIELLVVIAIIGILATISVLALNNARAKSRDAKRAGNMKQVQTALELFFNDKQRYPTVEEWATGQIYSTTTNSTSTYMQIIPTAPTPADGACGDKNIIAYTPTSDGSSYSVSFCLGGTTGTLDPGPKCLTPAGIIDLDCSVEIPEIILACSASTVGGSTCSYGGENYPTVTIGTQVWMAKNLNIGTRVDIFQSQGNYSSGIQKYCYNDHEINPDPGVSVCGVGDNCGGCDTDGGLYQWHMAVGKNQSCDSFYCSSYSGPCCDVTGIDICPTGWHVPTGTEWITLTNYLGGDSVSGNKLRETGASHWNTPNTGATNSSGFTGLPSGFSDPNGWTEGRATYNKLWSASAFTGDPGNPSKSLNRVLTTGDNFFNEDSNERTFGYSVRCLKD